MQNQMEIWSLHLVLHLPELFSRLANCFILLLFEALEHIRIWVYVVSMHRKIIETWRYTKGGVYFFVGCQDGRLGLFFLFVIMQLICFLQRNGSIDYDGWLTMYTGTDVFEDVGQIAAWNFNSTVNETYPFECNAVTGSAGEFFSPNREKTFADFFTPDVCR